MSSTYPSICCKRLAPYKKQHAKKVILIIDSWIASIKLGNIPGQMEKLSSHWASFAISLLTWTKKPNKMYVVALPVLCNNFNNETETPSTKQQFVEQSTKLFWL